MSIEMRVYVLHLRNASAFKSAFDCVMDAREVGSCLAEPERARIRFVAPRKIADALVERVYGDAGLIWCSRHDLRSPAAKTLTPRFGGEREL